MVVGEQLVGLSSRTAAPKDECASVCGVENAITEEKILPKKKAGNANGPKESVSGVCCSFNIIKRRGRRNKSEKVQLCGVPFAWAFRWSVYRSSSFSL